MILRLGKTKDGDNVINKLVYDVVDINISLKRTTDIVNPTLFLSGVGLDKYNYCEIVELGRKYFIRQVSHVNNSVVRLECECDYLETYKVDILNSSAKLRRPIKVGDYGSVELDTTGVEISNNYYSDVELVKSDKFILSLVGGA